jgi:hypothetical protein
MAVRGWIYDMVRTGVSPSDFPIYSGISSRPANEEQIIAHQQQHQERGSPDTYDMVNGVACHVDEYLGREGMSNEQLYAALRHVREQLAPVLTRRHQRSRRQQQQQYQD